jgi:hypothetical protein
MREPSAAQHWKRTMQAPSSPPPRVVLESGLCVDCVADPELPKNDLMREIADQAAKIPGNTARALVPTPPAAPPTGPPKLARYSAYRPGSASR